MGLSQFRVPFLRHPDHYGILGFILGFPNFGKRAYGGNMKGIVRVPYQESCELRFNCCSIAGRRQLELHNAIMTR